MPGCASSPTSPSASAAVDKGNPSYSLPCLLMREKDGLRLCELKTVPDSTMEEEAFRQAAIWEVIHGPAGLVRWAPSGERIVLVPESSTDPPVLLERCSAKGVSFTRRELPALPSMENLTKIRRVQWSPKGRHLIILWGSDSKAAADENPPKNLAVFNVAVSKREDARSEVTLEAAMPQRRVIESLWPIFRWTNDEKWAIKVETTSVSILKGNNITDKPLGSMEFPTGISSLTLRPKTTKESAGRGMTRTTIDLVVYQRVTDSSSSGRLTVVRVDIVHGGKAPPFASSFRTVASHQMGSMDEVEYHWSASAMGVLLLTNLVVDSAGKNYGSVTDVYYLRFSTAETILSCVNEDIVQDVAWSPTRDEFILIQGKSPSKIRLYDENCQVIYEFPDGYRNTVRWCPFGNMVAVGGFGNLAGDISFWYRDPKGQLTLIAEWREPCTVVCEWSPNGYLFLTASTRPRMKVDNNIKVFTFEGAEVVRLPISELYDACWIPLTAKTYPEPAAPKPNPAKLVTAKKQLYRVRNYQESTPEEEADRERRRQQKTAAKRGAHTSTAPSLKAKAKIAKLAAIDASTNWRVRRSIPTEDTPSASPHSTGDTGSSERYSGDGDSMAPLQRRRTGSKELDPQSFVANGSKPAAHVNTSASEAKKKAKGKQKAGSNSRSAAEGTESSDTTKGKGKADTARSTKAEPTPIRVKDPSELKNAAPADLGRQVRGRKAVDADDFPPLDCSTAAPAASRDSPSMSSWRELLADYQQGSAAAAQTAGSPKEESAPRQAPSLSDSQPRPPHIPHFTPQQQQVVTEHLRRMLAQANTNPIQSHHPLGNGSQNAIINTLVARHQQQQAQQQQAHQQQQAQQQAQEQAHRAPVGMSQYLDQRAPGSFLSMVNNSSGAGSTLPGGIPSMSGHNQALEQQNLYNMLTKLKQQQLNDQASVPSRHPEANIATSVNNLIRGIQLQGQRQQAADWTTSLENIQNFQHHQQQQRIPQPYAHRPAPSGSPPAQLPHQWSSPQQQQWNVQQLLQSFLASYPSSGQQGGLGQNDGRGNPRPPG